MLIWNGPDRTPESRIERRTLPEVLVDVVAGDEPWWVTVAFLVIPAVVIGWAVFALLLMVAR